MMREELTRREALQRTAALWASGWALAKAPASGAERTNPKRAGNPQWYQHAWRRAVIDMHIPDWDEKFLSQFDPDQYVAMLRQSRAQSVVMYAPSHVGLSTTRRRWASAAIADAAAFIFIDAIDPVGTVNPNAHERMGRIFDRLMP